jgi:hypothetical protein
LARRNNLNSKIPRSVRLNQTLDPNSRVELLASGDGEPKDGLKKFHMLGYTGATVNYWGSRFVIDLSGLKMGKEAPVFMSHNPDLIIGHGKVSMTSKGLEVDGEVSGVGDHVDTFLKQSSNGFPYQASVGIDTLSREFVQPGHSVKVNGRTETGPLVISRSSQLKEISVTPLGADGNTRTRVAASYFDGDSGMNKEFLKWLAAELGLSEQDFQALSDEAQEKLSAKYEATLEDDSDEDEEDKPKNRKPKLRNGKARRAALAAALRTFEKFSADEDADDDDSDDFDDDSNDDDEDDGRTPRGLSRTEFKRWTRAMELTDGNYALSREAIDRGLSDQEIRDAVELSDLRSSRKKMPKGGTGEDQRKRELSILECQMLLSMNFSAKDKQIDFTDGKVLAKHFDEKIVDEALERDGVGFKQMIATFARLEPKLADRNLSCYGIGDTQETLQALAEVNLAYSNASMPNSFLATCRRVLIERQQLAPPCTNRMWRRGSNPDFRPSTRMRINAGERWKKLTGDGKLRYFAFGDEELWQTFMDTSGGILIVKEQDVINDDLNVISQIIDSIAAMSDSTDYEFGRHFYQLDGPDNFYNEDPDNPVNPNVNVSRGADAVLSYENVFKAYEAMKKKKIKKGKEYRTIRVGERFTLLVPCELEREAWKLFVDNSRCDDCETNSEREYWRGRIDVKVWDEMSNESMFGDQAEKLNWALVTQNQQYTPYEMTTLVGRSGARVERVSLPADCLGFGVRFIRYGKLNPMDPCGIHAAYGS